MILRLKELLKHKGMSSIQLSEAVGVSKATVSYWINGKVFPTPDGLERIAEALDVPVWQLFVSPGTIPASPNGVNFVAMVRCNGSLYCANSLSELLELAASLKAKHNL